MRNLSIPAENYEICLDGLARANQTIDTIELPRRRRSLMSGGNAAGLVV